MEWWYGTQFRSRFTFQLFAGTLFLNKSLYWFYNERHHGKGPMDGVGGTIKKVTFQKVKSGQIVAHTPKGFSDAAIKFVPSIITVYLPRWDEIVEPESIHQEPSIPKTLSIYKFVWQINDRRDCSIEFFKTMVDQEAFHNQCYNNTGNAVCGHKKSGLQCFICEQWFHGVCFYV